MICERNKSKLKELFIHKLSNLTAKIIPYICQCTNLVTLRLSFTLPEIDLDTSSQICKLSKLENLYLDRQIGGLDDLVVIPIVLACRKISVLNLNVPNTSHFLSRASLSDKTMESITNFLLNINELDISNHTHITDKAIAKFVKKRGMGLIALNVVNTLASQETLQACRQYSHLSKLFTNPPPKPNPDVIRVFLSN